MPPPESRTYSQIINSFQHNIHESPLFIPDGQDECVLLVPITDATLSDEAFKRIREQLRQAAEKNAHKQATE